VKTTEKSISLIKNKSCNMRGLRIQLPFLLPHPYFNLSLSGKGQVSSLLYALIHLERICSPQTRDLRYGCPEVTDLNTTASLQNADSYTFYAKGMCLASPTCVSYLRPQYLTTAGGSCAGGSVSLGIYDWVLLPSTHKSAFVARRMLTGAKELTIAQKEDIYNCLGAFNLFTPKLSSVEITMPTRLQKCAPPKARIFTELGTIRGSLLGGNRYRAAERWECRGNPVQGKPTHQVLSLDNLV